MTRIREDLLDRLNKLADHHQMDVNHLLETWLDQHEYNLTLIDITLDAVITIDKGQTIVAYNNSAETIFGYSSEEAIGQHINLLLSPSDYDVHSKHIEKFAASNDTKRLMNRRGTIIGRRKNGDEFPAEASIGKSGIGDGQQFHVILRDISERIKAQQQLQQQEQQLRLMMNNINDAVCLHDANGVYRFVSPASIAVTGYTPEELIGNSPYDYFHPNDYSVLLETNEAVRNEENVNPSIYRFRHKDGHYVWLETNTNGIKDDNGNIIQFVTGTRNITTHIKTQQALQQERDLLEKIMNTSPSGITVLDKSGQIEFANKRSEDIFRLPQGDQIIRSYNSDEWKITDLDGSPWPDEKLPFVRVVTTKAPVYNVQHAIESPDGQRVLLSINGAPIFDEDDEIEKVVFTIEDITELKRAEESLQQLLEDERELTEVKSQFLSMVSHEFRTPLSVILTSTDIIERFNLEMLDERTIKRLEQIRRQVKYLDAQLKEISSLNKSSQSEITLNLKQVQVVDLLQQLIDEVTNQFDDSPPINLVTSYDRSVSFLLDAQLLQHIISNLISNAVKYSNGHGTITISLTSQDNLLKFVVQDEGIGIPKANQDNLFNFFYRADNVGSIKGMGIGLAVVKRSVTSHGGTITCESEVGVGTTFTVYLPIIRIPSSL